MNQSECTICRSLFQNLVQNLVGAEPIDHSSNAVEALEDDDIALFVHSIILLPRAWAHTNHLDKLREFLSSERFC